MSAAMLPVGIAVSVAVFSALGWGASLNPKVASGEVQIKRVCMLPLEVSMQKSGMKGGEGMSKESEVWAAQLGEVMTAHIRQSGAELVWGPADVEKSPEPVRQAVIEVQRKYDTVALQLHKKFKDLKKSRFTLGDDVAILPCAAKSDALLFVHGDATVLTGGKKAFGALVAGPSKSSAVVRTAFVDPKSGEVLAYSQFIAMGDKFRKDPAAAYRKPLTNEFKKMYIGGNLSKKKK